MNRTVPYLAITLICLFVALAIAELSRADGRPRVWTSSTSTGAPIAGRYAIRILDARDKTRRCQRTLGLDPSPVSAKPVIGAAYARWVLALWRARAQAYCGMARTLGHPVAAIRAVFGSHADEALIVSRCESGRSRSPRAHNGQYRGMFQMGASERARYGHGDTPLEQAVAAHRYFVASGRDWSPWSCKPNGSVQ